MTENVLVQFINLPFHTRIFFSCILKHVEIRSPPLTLLYASYFLHPLNEYVYKCIIYIFINLNGDRRKLFAFNIRI